MHLSTPPKGLEAFAFDAYGTLFDVFSVTSLCEALFPGNGNALAQLWRAKQLHYSLLRSVMDRFEDFWQLTGDSLVYAARSLNLDLADAKRQSLMDAYLRLAAFPDVKPGLEALKNEGLRLAILSNGAPRMLHAAVASAGLGQWLDEIISVNDVRIFKPSPRVYELIEREVERAGEPDRVRLVELVGYQWCRRRGTLHILDPAKPGGAAGGTRLSGQASRQHHRRARTTDSIGAARLQAVDLKAQEQQQSARSKQRGGADQTQRRNPRSGSRSSHS